MINPEDLSPEREAQLRRLQEHKKLIADEEQKLYRDLGITNSAAPADPVAAMQQEDAESLLYDRLTPAELVDLYENDRSRWKEIMRAKERVGLRKLFGGGR